MSKKYKFLIHPEAPQPAAIKNTIYYLRRGIATQNSQDFSWVSIKWTLSHIIKVQTKPDQLNLIQIQTLDLITLLSQKKYHAQKSASGKIC